MNKTEFKKLFGEVAKNQGFKEAFSGWFKETQECIVILELQKSNYGNYYELNIKTYIQGIFGRQYSIDKDLVKKTSGQIFTRHPKEYNDIFDLDSNFNNELRREKLELLFKEFIVPYTNKSITQDGIKELVANGEFILPAVKKELGLK